MHEHNACSFTSEPSQSSSRPVRPLRIYHATEQLNHELHKSEVLLITSTLLVVKDEDIYRNTKYKVYLKYI